MVHFAQNPNVLVLFNQDNLDNVSEKGHASAKHQFDTADKSQIMYFDHDTEIGDFVEFFKYL